MTPRRLIPYLVVFLVVVAVFVGLQWQQARKLSREEQEKRVVNFKAADISAITLKRGTEEIQMTRQGAGWEIVKPLKALADKATMETMVTALSELKKERSLGAGELKTYGLDQPPLVVTFTAKGEQHHIVLGQQAPGDRGYYALKDKDPNIFLIDSNAWHSLNQRLTNLRDKTLLAFSPEQVKAIKIRGDKGQVDLEKSDDQAWRWVARPDFRVRRDRVEGLLRLLVRTRINDFPAEPKDLKALGLAPQARTEITLTTPQGPQTLFLGTPAGTEVYARLGAQGEVVKVGKTLSDNIARIVSTLEDRRLWSGSISQVAKVVWGAPDRTWTAVRDGQDWKITGPDKAELKKPLSPLEMALVSFQQLEYTSLLPQAGASGKAVFTLELFDAAGKPLLHLEELGKKGATEVEVRAKSGDTTLAATVPEQKFSHWQGELSRFTAPPAPPTMPAPASAPSPPPASLPPAQPVK